jgi:hypothetical protein
MHLFDLSQRFWGWRDVCVIADHSGHGEGKHDQRDMTVPTMPRTRFVMVEAEFILRRFKTVFDRPPMALDPSEGFDRGSLWAPGCEVRSIAIGNVAADQKAAGPCAGVALPLNPAPGALGESGQNMGVMRRVFCLRRSADHRELRPL